MDEIQKLTAQRDTLARYVFEQNDGALYASHCRRQMEAGRCPYHGQPCDTDRTVGICVPCIVKMIGEGVTAPPFFSLLADYHLLVSYFVICGTLETGRVQTVEDGTITFQAKGKTKRYRLEEIDVIVPMEVLRWSHDELTPVAWSTIAKKRVKQEEPVAPRGDISSCLLSIGIQPYMQGFAELETAIHLAIGEPALLERVGDRFYPALAEKTGRSAGTVTYRISKLITIAKRNSSESGNYEAFYSAIAGRGVSIKAFLFAFLRYMHQRDALPP